MRGRSIAYFALLAAGSLAIAAPQSETDPKLCTVRGTVTNALNGEPLRKAYVRLHTSAASYPAVSDDRGQFAIEGIAPGSYTVEAERVGFVERSLSDAANQERLSLAPGQALTDLVIKLMPEAVISGRVVDEDGDPYTHAAITLSRSVWKHGRREIEGSDSTGLNNADFRFGNVAPGVYYLNAEPERVWEMEHTPQTKEPVLPRRLTWYPSSLDAAGATPLVVRPGDQIAGVEIRLRRGTVHSIRGKVVGLESVPPPENKLFTAGVSAEPAEGEGGSGGIKPDGSFEIPNLSPGKYDLRVRQGYFPSFVLGSLNVQVGDRDLDGVVIQVTAPGPVKGVIQVAELGALDPSGLEVSLNDDGPITGNESATVNPDGSFEIPKVGAGTYRVVIRSKAKTGFYVKQVRYGDTTSGDAAISLPEARAGFTVVLSTKGARLTGRVTPAGNSSVETKPQVILVPDGPPGQARQALLDQNGMYSFSETLPPGSYKLYAFEGVPDGAWEDPGFMKEVSTKGTSLRLAEGDTQSVDVMRITKTDLAPVLQKLGME